MEGKRQGMLVRSIRALRAVIASACCAHDGNDLAPSLQASRSFRGRGGGKVSAGAPPLETRVSCPHPLGAGWRPAFPGRISLEDACIGGRDSIRGGNLKNVSVEKSIGRMAPSRCPGLRRRCVRGLPVLAPRPPPFDLVRAFGGNPRLLIVRGLNRQSPFAVVRLCSLSILRQAQDIANSRPRTLNELREELCAQWNEVGRGRGEPTDRTLAPHRFPRLHR